MLHPEKCYKERGFSSENPKYLLGESDNMQQEGLGIIFMAIFYVISYVINSVINADHITLYRAGHRVLESSMYVTILGKISRLSKATFSLTSNLQ